MNVDEFLSKLSIEEMRALCKRLDTVVFPWNQVNNMWERRNLDGSQAASVQLCLNTSKGKECSFYLPMPSRMKEREQATLEEAKLIADGHLIAKDKFLME